MPFHILVGSYTDAVYTLTFDPSKPEDSSLSLSSTLKVGHHPSWIEHHPSDPAIVFTGLEQADGRLLAIKYNLSNGEGKVVADSPSGGQDPCTILATKAHILVGNYSSGNVSIFDLPSPTEPITLKETQPPLQFSGSGPCAERQGSSHPHQVYLANRSTADVSGPKDEVLVPDLGSDKVWRLARSAEGKWEKKGEVTFDKHPGGGPRHVVVHDSKLYTLLELTSQLTVHDFQSSGVEPIFLVDTTLPMPNDLAPLQMLAAEILCPQPNTRFPSSLIYVSNRNDPRPHGDLISIFAPIKGSSTDLVCVGEFSTGLAHVRGFTFFGPENRYVVAGGANGGGVKVFERIDEGKTLKQVAHLPASDGGAGLAPTAFLCL